MPSDSAAIAYRCASGSADGAALVELGLKGKWK